MYKTNKEHSRSAGSVLGKCIYFWKVLVETSSTVYIIAAPIEVKGQKSGGQLLAKIQFFTFCARKTWVEANTMVYLNSAHEAESNDIQHDPVRTIPEGTPSTHRASMYIS